MNKIKTSLLVLSLLSSFSVFAKTKIKNISFKTANKEGVISIKLQGNLEDTPELTIRDQMIQVAIPNVVVWPKIEKKVTIGKEFDTTLMAYQFDKNLVRFRLLLPYTINGSEDLVSLTLKENQIDVHFPKLISKAINTKTKVAKKVKIKKLKPVVVKKNNVNKYDESYLEKLLKSKEQKAAKNVVVGNKKVEKSLSQPATDKVNMALAGTEKSKGLDTNSSFSLGGYIGKFVAFLGVVLLFFYVAVSLMKKGVLKKGKLGFLNSTKSVEVLNTTYVGPKKSLLLVKAHNQVFLVGSSDQGIQLVSEINDVAGLLKEGERSIAGNNFDSSLGTAQSTEQNFKLKEVITPINTEDEIKGQNQEAKSLADLIDREEVTKSVKFSDQIKSKVKGLKSLQ
jgi:flagellar biogenesis protein FliO